MYVHTYLLKVREISDIVNSGIQPLQNLSVITKYSSEPDKKVEWANFWISKGLAGIYFAINGNEFEYVLTLT